MAKGSIGTPMRMVYIKDKRKKFKKKSGTYFCYGCKRLIAKGEWVSPFANRLYKHTYKSECTPELTYLKDSE